MPVVINNFEVVAEPPAGAESPAGAAAQRGAGEASAAQLPGAAAPAPHDIERILRRRAERLARVWAQ